MAFAEINIPSHYTNSIHSNIINKWVTEFRSLTNSKEKPILKWARLNECYQNDTHWKEIFKMCVAFQSLAEGWLSVAHSSTWKFWAKLLSHIFFDIFLSFLAPPPSRFLSHSQCIYWHLNIQKSLSSNSPKISFTLFPKFSKLTMIQILFRWKSIMCYCSKHIKKHNPPSNTCISNKHCLDHQCFIWLIKNKVSYWINMVTMYWQNYYTKIP